jgi:sulfur carrier protein ThiS
MLTYKLNGKVNTITLPKSDDTNIPQLLKAIGLSLGHVAIKVNGKSILSKLAPQTLLAMDDDIDIVSILAGG